MDICNKILIIINFRDCVQVLIQAGAQLVGNDSGNTPLRTRYNNKHSSRRSGCSFATSRNCKVFINIYTECGCITGWFHPILCDLQKNAFGQSAVDVAFQTGNEDMINILLSHDSAQILEEGVGYHGEEV